MTQARPIKILPQDFSHWSWGRIILFHTSCSLLDYESEAAPVLSSQYLGYVSPGSSFLLGLVSAAFRHCHLQPKSPGEKTLLFGAFIIMIQRGPFFTHFPGSVPGASTQ